MSVPAGSVTEGIARARERIAVACDRVGRPPDDVGLVVVTKTHPPETVAALVAAGQLDVGENRAQELAAKADRVDGARWHFVGRLQRNKAADVVGRAVLVHSVDNGRLVDRVADVAAAAGIVQRVLLQVNVGDDPRKGGVDPDGLPALVERAAGRDSLRVEGLMAVPPLPPDDVDPNEHARPHFAHLRSLFDALRGQWPEMTELSMGMSADVEAAVEEGATVVRLGTTVLGPRLDPPWEPTDTKQTEARR